MQKKKSARKRKYLIKSFSTSVVPLIKNTKSEQTGNIQENRNNTGTKKLISFIDDPNIP